MPAGGCLCGACRINYTGEIQAKALCHCTDCHKISGSAFSTNIIVPGDGFSVSAGKPKEYAKKGDNSGNTVISHFCGDCGSTLWRDGPSFGDGKVIKVGVLDDSNAFNTAKPAIELYAPGRVPWVKPVDGADQLKDMPGSASVA